MKKLSRIFALLLLLGGFCFPQSTPTFKSGVIYLSRFIASDYFFELKNSSNHLDLVDTLYVKAINYYREDYSEALLALTFASLPYKELPVQVPVIGWRINIPLPAVPEPFFGIKTRNLPSRLLPDSPSSEFGDKDKLSHFFGNAFLEYNFPFFNFSKFLGIFVEKFEETFYVQGAMDNRDLIVNRLGAQFGKALCGDKNLRPSQFFKKYSGYKK